MSNKLCKTLAMLLCFILCAVLCPAAFAEGSESQPVAVLFDCIDESALPGLHVTDEAGNEYAPNADDETGSALYGHYLLNPGEYLYWFHDEQERYEDFDGAFSVDEALRLIIPIDLTPVVEIESFSFTYIDPIYEDDLTPADIPQADVDDEAIREELRELAAVLSNNPKRLRARSYWNQHTYYDTIEEAAADLKMHVKAFDSTAVIRFTANASWTESQLQTYFMNIWYAAIAHTGVPTEGDYLRYEHGGFTATSASLPEGRESGLSYNIVTVSLNHFSTFDQEEALSPVVDTILASFNLEGKSDLQKVAAIYDYLCTNVTYDFNSSGNLKRTAYAALVNHTAVCQGYSAAFYRLCLTAGVDSRMITCSDIAHAWNIAQLNGQYYELDATWDRQKTPATYSYFLKGSEEWPSSHSSIGDQYYATRGSFDKDSYPLSAESVPIVSFSSDGGSEIMPQYVLDGGTAFRPTLPVKDGYWFVDWYTDSGLETRYDFDAPVTGDLALCARWAVPDLLLPGSLTAIGEEAFSGGAFSFAKLPEATASIGPRAFAGCPKLICVYIPQATTSIDEHAFEGITELTVFGAASSKAETFARQHGFVFSEVS